MRYFKDRDGDVWICQDDGRGLICFDEITEQVQEAERRRKPTSLDWAEDQHDLVELIEKPQRTGEISDGHHTFDELYEHRRALTAALAFLAGAFPDVQTWRSRAHHPGEGPMFDGSFIVGIELPTGSIIYHYKLEHWDDFSSIPELDHSPHWDGVGPAGTIQRLLTFARGIAHKAGHDVTVQADDRRWTAHQEDWSNGVLLDAPESWDGDEAADSIALSYVATIEARMDAAGMSREKWIEQEDTVTPHYGVPVDTQDDTMLPS